VNARLVVTTGEGAREQHAERAALLAARFSLALARPVPYVARARADHSYVVDVDAAGGADVLYVVHRWKEELVHRDGRRTHVQPGPLPTKLQQGEAHALIRAVRGGSVDERIGSVFDATLGLANDAVHVATVTGAVVVGAEASVVLHALLEEGLVRMAASGERWAEAATRITALHGDSASVLAGRDDDSVDVVTVDPMMALTRRNAPAFDLVRAFAKMDLASPTLLREARRVARRRVVLKIGKGAELPVSRPYEFGRAFYGAHVAYWVHDKAHDRVFVDDGANDHGADDGADDDDGVRAAR
jgi:hypothetical protein